jgi:hypothetical protein
VGRSDRKGRDGLNPSSTHLRGVRGKMCRRGACPLATLAVVGSHTEHRLLQFALMGLVPPSSYIQFDLYVYFGGAVYTLFEIGTII